MLSPKQKRILDFIKKFISEYGFAPTYREIGKGVGLSSPATIHEHIMSLKEQGYLEAEPRPRMLTPRDLKLDEVLRIPLAGVVPAGSPVQVFEYKEHIVIPKKLITKPAAKLFALKVMGDSMIEEGIFDGDYVICEKEAAPQNGDSVIALLESGEVTLKKFYKEKNSIRLEPRNKKLKPIFTKNVKIQGIVRAVIRKY